MEVEGKIRDLTKEELSEFPFERVRRFLCESCQELYKQGKVNLGCLMWDSLKKHLRDTEGPWKKVKEEYAVRDYEAGIDVETITKRYRISSKELYGILRSRGIALREEELLEEKLIKDYESGLPVDLIREKYRIGRDRMYSILRSHGVKLRKG